MYINIQREKERLKVFRELDGTIVKTGISKIGRVGGQAGDPGKG